jgi:hypothetical protein
MVSAIEPCLGFWQKLGFQVTVTVPETAPFDFAMVARDSFQVMLQTQASVRNDMPGVAERVTSSLLYLSVASLDAVIAALADMPIVVKRRTTFYGADEIFVADPCGNVIGLAAHGGEEEHAAN